MSGRLVYSTDHGKMCSQCRHPVSSCVCRRDAPPPVSDGMVRVSLETKGRNGKGVTVIKGVALDLIALSQLGKELKIACGSGGTVKDGVIEVQGDHVAFVMEQLKNRGWKVKRGGG